MRPARFVRTLSLAATMAAILVLSASAAEARTMTVGIPLTTPQVGFETEVIVTVEGEYDWISWEADPTDPTAPARLVLRARKGKLGLERSGITAAVAEGREGVLESFHTEFVIDSSGRFAAIELHGTLSRGDGSAHRPLPPVSIRVLMEMAYMLHVPVKIEAQSPTRVGGGDGTASYQFDVRFDATGAPKDIGWMFLRYELFDSRGNQVQFAANPGEPPRAAHYASTFEDVQKKNTVRVISSIGVSVDAAIAASQLRIRGIVVGMDSDGLLIVQPIEVQLPTP